LFEGFADGVQNEVLQDEAVHRRRKEAPYMLELVKLILEKLDGYFRTAINLAASPRMAPESLGIFDRRRLTDGLTFFGISLVISLVVKMAFIPASVDLAVYIAQDALWKIILIASAAAAARLSWFGHAARYGDYLVASCYFLGMLSIAVPLLLVVSRALPSGWPYLVNSLLMTVYTLIVAGYCLAAWLSFGVHNSASLVETLSRLPIFVVLFSAVSIFSVLVRMGTVERTATAHGALDYTAEGGRLSHFLTFGLFP
jgi:hypothetical protein